MYYPYNTVLLPHAGSSLNNNVVGSINKWVNALYKNSGKKIGNSVENSPGETTSTSMDTHYFVIGAMVEFATLVTITNYIV